MLKQNKGITLVALVITIIVLLILAGVSISLVVGDNGVLTQSQNAAKKTDAASANTAVQLTMTSLSTKFMGDVWTNNVNAKIYNSLKASDIISELSNNGYTVKTYTVGTTDLKTNSTYYINGTDAVATTTPATASITIYEGTNDNGTTYTFTLGYNTAGTGLNPQAITAAD